MSVSFGRTRVAATMTISLEYMAIADQEAEIRQACQRLHRLGIAAAVGTVVAAGGEIGFDGELVGTTQALVVRI